MLNHQILKWFIIIFNFLDINFNQIGILGLLFYYYLVIKTIKHYYFDFHNILICFLTSIDIILINEFHFLIIITSFIEKNVSG